MATIAATGVPAVASRHRRWRLIRQSTWEFVRGDILPALVTIAVAIAIWAIVTAAVTFEWLPTPTDVASRIWTLLGQSDFRSALLGSVGFALLGFALGMGVGLVVGIAMALSSLADITLRYYVNALLIVPSVALAPIFLIVFGLTNKALVAIIFVFSFSVIAVTTRSAVGGVDLLYSEVGQVFGANRLQLVLHFVLPAALPNTFAGLHLGMARAMKGMVIGELILAVTGVGKFLANFQQSFDTLGVWAIAVLLVAVALVLTWAVKLLDHGINYWARASDH